jgi:dTDP-glucose 4,6-dehydratase
MTYQPKNMLVTGGAGFIGANFIRHVLATNENIKITNLDKLTYAGTLENLKDLQGADRHHFAHGDIRDAALVRDLLHSHHIDTIVHFAAESHVDRSITGPEEFVSTNVMGTFTLLEAARLTPGCRFHHISTDEVYGSLLPTDPMFTEKTAYSPRSPYSASKAASDHLVNAYFHTYGLPITISNCSNNYGPYQHGEKLIPTIIRCCVNWQPIPIYGNGTNIRDWLYVEDHCRGIMKIVQEGVIGDNYNIGGHNEWENLRLARYICEQMDVIKPRAESYSTLLNFVTDRPGHDFRYAIDAAKMQSDLNWVPEETLESGIKKTIAFYIQ